MGAAHSHWLVKSSWWRPKKLVVEEVMGTKRRTGLAKMIDNGKGVLWIRGKFIDNLPNPYFRLSLSSHVSSEDFQLGYSMSGQLHEVLKNTSHSKLPIWLSSVARTFRNLQLLQLNKIRKKQRPKLPDLSRISVEFT